MAKKERSKFQRTVDAFCRGIFLTEDGRPKSANLLYSFCLALLFSVVYIASYWLLVDVFEALFSAWPMGWQVALQYILPGVIGSVPCVALMFALRGDRKAYVPLAYNWLAVLFIAILITALVMSKEFTDVLLFMIILIPMFVSTVSGGVASHLLYYLGRKSQAYADR